MLKYPPSSLAIRWLWLGVSALGMAGLFALVLVIGRTPQLAALGVMQHLFSVALVVHVDLSVLVWFLCIGGMGWGMLAESRQLAPRYWLNAGFWTLAAATGLIALSPLHPHWEVLKSNYIPVLNNLPFLGGLGLLAAGLLVLLLPLLRGIGSACGGALSHVERLFYTAGITTLMALLAFAVSAYALPPGLPTEERFNTLFWAGGHVLQTTFTLLMLAGWMALYETMAARPLPLRVVRAANAGMLCVAALSLWPVLSLLWMPGTPALSVAFGDVQTRVMVELGGIAPILIAVAMLVQSLRYPVVVTRETRVYLATLLASLIVFGAGGGIGLMIAGQNVVIPAHYHGEIVGVTLALMGFAYTMLPRLGGASVAASRLAFWQPILYGVGQLMHVGGLAYSGGYGVLRKTAGGFAAMAPEVKIALGIMGLGGTLAILGGLLFVAVMLRALCSRNQR